MPRIQIQVRDLRPGDVLVPTNRTVVRASRGVRTPSGKTDVDLKRAGSEEVRRCPFGSYTRVTVLRERRLAGAFDRS